MYTLTYTRLSTKLLDAEIPESFKRGMREIASGEVNDLNEALDELERPE
jgi:hypothetical protein